MGRIRTIKPDFPQSESMGRVSRDARLCFILLWTVADDEGRLRGSPQMLARLLFPYDEDSTNIRRGLDEHSPITLRGLVEDSLHQLQDQGCINWYERDGAQYIEICKWLNHQKIDRPSKSKIPAFDEHSTRIRRTFDEDSTTDKEEDKEKDKEGITPPYPPSDSLTQISVIEKKDNQKQKKPKNETIDPDPMPCLPEWIPVDLWVRYVEMRKKMKAPLTHHAMSLAIGTLAKLRDEGSMPTPVIESTLLNGWKGFFPVKKPGGVRVADNSPEARLSYQERMSRLADEIFGPDEEAGVIDG